MKKQILRWLALACILVMTLGASSALAASDGLEFYEDRNGFSYASWEYKQGDIRIDLQLRNRSKTYAVDAVDIAIYCMDINGDPIYPEDSEDGYIRYFSNKVNIKRGETEMYGECIMEGCDETITFGIAITRYHFKDGGAVKLAKEGETDPLKMYDWKYWDVR